MLEKLLVRVRSWLHIDPSAGTATVASASGSGAMAGPAMAPAPALGTQGFSRKASGKSNTGKSEAKQASAGKSEAKQASAGKSEAKQASAGASGNGSLTASAANARDGRKRAPTPSAAPPPPPADAYAPVALEAQSESGMVITDSGIIIIDPTSGDPALDGKSNGSRPGDVSASGDAWAVPNLTSNTGSMTAAADPGDWDSVLARARAQLAPPAVSPAAPAPRKPRG